MKLSPRWALLIVDLQRYYLDEGAPFVRFFEAVSPGASDFVRRRCQEVVLPALAPLVQRTRQLGRPVVYLRLCGRSSDRSDLHRHFQAVDREALELGFGHIYPLSSEPLADVAAAVAPAAGDLVLDKQTYSGFTSTALHQELQRLQVDQLAVAGLATSQCVDTTARDASDHGYEVIQLEDALADYHQISHQAALWASRMVCGGCQVSCAELLAALHEAPPR